jgi:thymidylate synthase (FAD)
VVEPATMVDVYGQGWYQEFAEAIREGYGHLQTVGVPNEDARYILPNACATSLYLSCNLRELIHMANERLCTRAQWEIRDLVREMCRLVDPQLQFMLVPKCKSGRIICNSPCGGKV